MGIQKDLKFRRALVALVLMIPFLLIVVLPLYNRASPALMGIPMFYWYQLAWLVALSALLAIAHVLMGGERA